MKIFKSTYVHSDIKGTEYKNKYYKLFRKYSKAFYIRDADKFVILSNSKYSSPLTVNINCNHLDALDINEIFYYGENSITSKNCTIELSTGKEKNLTISSEYTNLNTKDVEFIGEYISKNGNEDGIKKAVFNEKLEYSPLEKSIRTVFFQIDNLEIPKWLKYLSNMIGLGIGLTPSIDDFLTGIMASIYAFNYKELLQYIKLNSKRTTLVSSIILCEAFKGNFDERIKMFFNSNYLYRKEYLLDNIKNIGHSSGTDILCGIYLFLKKIKEINYK